MGVEWKNLQGVVAHGKGYWVSSSGDVWSTKTNRILKYALGNGGYPFVTLSQKGDTKPTSVHRLVALAFLGNPPDPRSVVNHIDGNKLNRSVNNLEWLSQGENLKHAYRVGLRRPLPRSNPRNAVEANCRPVAKLSNSGQILGVYRSTQELFRHDNTTPTTTVYYQCKNESFSTRNPFYFRYASEEQVREAKESEIFFDTKFDEVFAE